MGWSQEHVQALIECYKANECLYINCTIADIKSKWNGLRTNYLSECRKYESTQKSGAGADDILKPSLWYFDLMRFIDKYSNPRQSTDVLDITAIDNKDDEIDNGNGVVIEYMDESDIENHDSSFSPPATPIFVTDNNGPSTSTSSLKAKRICSSENASPTHSVRRSKKVCREDKIVEEQTLTLTAIRTAIEQRKNNNGPSTSGLSIKSKRIRTSENDSPTPLRPSKKVCRVEKIVQEQMLTLSAICTAIEQRKSTVPLSSNSFGIYVAYRLNSITDDDIRAMAEEEITEVLFRNKYHNV
ncbi:hypothetical protein FQA39_LY16008 [Lamprigera yunnana]|nr:hypothetical protein FQA39_LY16008 [Lamprigera yunnana]